MEGKSTVFSRFQETVGQTITLLRILSPSRHFVMCRDVLRWRIKDCIIFLVEKNFNSEHFLSLNTIYPVPVPVSTRCAKPRIDLAVFTFGGLTGTNSAADISGDYGSVSSSRLHYCCSPLQVSCWNVDGFSESSPWGPQPWPVFVRFGIQHSYDHPLHISFPDSASKSSIQFRDAQKSLSQSLHSICQRCVIEL